MWAVVSELQARGRVLCLSEWDDSRCIQIVVPNTVRCELTVNDGGLVEWEYQPAPTYAASPVHLTALILSILGAASDDVPNISTRPGQTLKGAVGRLLHESGLQVELEVTRDMDYYEVSAELDVRNPGCPERGRVLLSDNGCILWEACYHDEVPGFCGANQSMSYLSAASAVAGVVVAGIRLLP
jgi:hypothetical protein